MRGREVGMCGSLRPHRPERRPQGFRSEEAMGHCGASINSILPAITVIKAALSSTHYPVFTTLPEKQKPAQLGPSQSVLLSEWRERFPPDAPRAGQ